MPDRIPMQTKPPETQPDDATYTFRAPRFSHVQLLVVLALLFFFAPFLDNLPAGDLIEALLITAVMVWSVLAVSNRRRDLNVALLLLLPTVVGKWVNHLSPSPTSALVYLFGAVALFGFVVACLIRFIMRAPRVDANVLCAGLSGYLLLGLLWLPAYILVARLDPGAFSVATPGSTGVGLDRFTAFYFSFITLCTVGYGDVTPASKVARMLAITEAIAGLFYVAVLISRLVAIYSSNQSPPPDPDVESGRSSQASESDSE